VPLYRRHRIVHIHIPKTGGTAISQLFYELGDFDYGLDGWMGVVRRDGRWYEYQHLTLAEFTALSGGEFDGYRRLSVVRDPYQRVISDYRWRLALGPDNPGSIPADYDSFAQFVRSIPADLDTGWREQILEADRSHANLLIHLRPQHHYLCGDEGRIDPSVKVVRFEDLPSAFDAALEPWGVENRGIRGPVVRDLASSFDNETLQIVNETYRRDFEVFGYAMLSSVDGVRR